MSNGAPRTSIAPPPSASAARLGRADTIGTSRSASADTFVIAPEELSTWIVMSAATGTGSGSRLALISACDLDRARPRGVVDRPGQRHPQRVEQQQVGGGERDDQAEGGGERDPGPQPAPPPPPRSTAQAVPQPPPAASRRDRPPTAAPALSHRRPPAGTPRRARSARTRRPNGASIFRRRYPTYTSTTLRSAISSGSSQTCASSSALDTTAPQRRIRYSSSENSRAVSSTHGRPAPHHAGRRGRVTGRPPAARRAGARRRAAAAPAAARRARRRRTAWSGSRPPPRSSPSAWSYSPSLADRNSTRHPVLLGPQLLADLVTGNAGQHDVEHDAVVAALARHVQPADPVKRDIDREPRRLKAALHRGGQPPLVLHDKHAHGSSVDSPRRTGRTALSAASQQSLSLVTASLGVRVRMDKVRRRARGRVRKHASENVQASPLGRAGDRRRRHRRRGRGAADPGRAGRHRTCPTRTPAQLLAELSTDAKVPPMTGTVVETASLGLPQLPQTGNATSCRRC